VSFTTLLYNFGGNGGKAGGEARVGGAGGWAGSGRDEADPIGGAIGDATDGGKGMMEEFGVSGGKGGTCCRVASCKKRRSTCVSFIVAETVHLTVLEHRALRVTASRLSSRLVAFALSSDEAIAVSSRDSWRETTMLLLPAVLPCRLAQRSSVAPIVCASEGARR